MWKWVGYDGENFGGAGGLSLPNGKMATISDAYVDAHHNPDITSFKFHYEIMREQSEDCEGGLRAASTSLTFNK
jgi:hypothetical protein